MNFFSLLILFWTSSLLRPFFSCTMHNAKSGLGQKIQNLGASSLLALFLGCTMHNAQSRLGQRIQNSGASSLLALFWAAQCTMHNQDMDRKFRIWGLAASWPFFLGCTMHNQDLVSKFRIRGLAASWPFFWAAQCTIKTWSTNSEFGG